MKKIKRTPTEKVYDDMISDPNTLSNFLMLYSNDLGDNRLSTQWIAISKYHPRADNINIMKEIEKGKNFLFWNDSIEGKHFYTPKKKWRALQLKKLGL